MYERIYYPINETSARIAHEMMSMRDYEDGSRTAEYRRYADKAYDLAERIEKAKPRQADRAWKIATAYARRMATYFDTDSRIGMMCPSVMISGAGNFPVKKKERQVAAWSANHKEYEHIQEYLSKLERILTGKEAIRADDEDAIILLEEKVSTLEAEQELMKEVNAFYRKNKTLEGCPELTPERAEKIEAAMARWNNTHQPFATYTLTNNNANIRRLKGRIEELKAEKERGNSEEEVSDLGFTVKEDTDIMRLQLFFDDKPEPEVRDILKHRAFKWSPRNGCWQRQLTNDARYALKQIVKQLREMNAATGGAL